MITALVLAAGSSRRMGQPKLLLTLQGRPLIRRAVELALESTADEILVVLGPHQAEMEQALQGLAVRTVANPEHLSGMASSLRAGLAAVRPTTQAVVILLGDQPFQDSSIVDRLIAEYRRSGRPIVVPVYDGKRGNPVLFDRALFGDLMQQKGDLGGRDLIEAIPERVALVHFDSAQPQLDLDTWDDYLAARGALGES